ncbi:MAG: MFS transporter [Anaerolineales bacterium]|nr:MFS transporter [Anaerolineales bacterium]
MSNWNEKNWKSRFFTIWGGQAFSLFGSHLVQFALVWWLTQKTGSATILATASLVGFLPQVVLGPIVGTLVDRSKRRWIMVGADSLIALTTLGLVYLFAIQAVEVWMIYVVLFLRSLGGGFHHPAMTASTSLMVPKTHLTRIQGLNQMLMGAMGIISAPLGALLLEMTSTQAVLMIDVITAIIAVLPLLFIAIPEPERTNGKITAGQPAEKPSFWEDFKAGFAYVWAWPGLVMILLLAMLINFLLNPAGSLMPLLVKDHFGGGALQLGWMESMFGVGMLVGGLVLGAWGGFKKRIITSMVGLIGLGLFFATMGLLPASFFKLALVISFLAAFMNPIVNGPIMAIIQATVAPEMQGRVFTLIGSLASAMAPLGLIIAGPVADALGVQSWYIIGGITCAVVGVSGFFIPVVMNIEENRKAEVEREAAQEPGAVVPVV